jgi:hypothetical protein
MNDLIQANPAATLAAVIVFMSAVTGLGLGLLRWSLAQNYRHVDEEISQLWKGHTETRKRLRAVETAQLRAEGEARAARAEAKAHMEREETLVWPQVTKAADAMAAIHRRFDDNEREQAAAHGVIGERLTRLETLIINGSGKKAHG